MSVRVIVGVLALAGVSACGIASTVVHNLMVEQVNAKLAAGDQFFPLWWNLTKTQRLNREYRRLYPEGRLLVGSRALGALMFACVLTCMWAIGLPSTYR
jgi:hypothetical protein